MESAIRFRQISDLRQLALSKPDGPLTEWVTEHNPQYLNALQRVLFGPDVRWRTFKKGSIGTFVDTSVEWRLIWLVEWAEETRSPAVLALAHDVFNYLVTGWKDGKETGDINPTILAIEALDKAPWATAHGAGNMRGVLLKAVLSEMDLARHFEWKTVLDYQRDGPVWSDEDENMMDDALHHYCTEGADNELWDCTIENELLELRDGLLELEIEYGLSVRSVCENAEGKLAEYERPYDDEPGFRSRGSVSATPPREPANDEEIRNLFRTLE
jgi:hypothetical protein